MSRPRHGLTPVANDVEGLPADCTEMEDVHFVLFALTSRVRTAGMQSAAVPNDHAARRRSSMLGQRTRVAARYKSNQPLVPEEVCNASDFLRLRHFVRMEVSGMTGRWR